MDTQSWTIPFEMEMKFEYLERKENSREVIFWFRLSFSRNGLSDMWFGIRI